MTDWIDTQELTRKVNNLANQLDVRAGKRDTLGTMRYVAEVNEGLAEVATACVEIGVHQGLTQKDMADALGVPPSTLRGAKQEFSRA